MKLKEKISNQKLGLTLRACTLSASVSESIINAICDLAESDTIFFARWIMVQLCGRNNYVRITFAVHDYCLVNTEDRRCFHLLDSDDVELLSQSSKNCIKLYTQQTFYNLRKFLKEQGFENIGTELPFENNNFRPVEEMDEWYALEI